MGLGAKIFDANGGDNGRPSSGDEVGVGVFATDGEEDGGDVI